jgi:ABC-type phosphate/phosphonate transport system permease subunit
MPCLALGVIPLLEPAKEGDVYQWMTGWGGFWTTFVMAFWIVLWGAMVYVPVKMADRPPSGPRSQH